MQPETQSARSRRSYGKIEDCEQSKNEMGPIWKRRFWRKWRIWQKRWTTANLLKKISNDIGKGPFWKRRFWWICFNNQGLNFDWIYLKCNSNQRGKKKKHKTKNKTRPAVLNRTKLKCKYSVFSFKPNHKICLFHFWPFNLKGISSS